MSLCLNFLFLSFSLIDELQGTLDPLLTTESSILTAGYTRTSVSARSVDFMAAVHSCVVSVNADHGISDSVFSYQVLPRSSAFECRLPTHESRHRSALADDLFPIRAYNILDLSEQHDTAVDHKSIEAMRGKFVLTTLAMRCRLLPILYKKSSNNCI